MSLSLLVLLLAICGTTALVALKIQQRAWLNRQPPAYQPKHLRKDYQ